MKTRYMMIFFVLITILFVTVSFGQDKRDDTIKSLYLSGKDFYYLQVVSPKENFQGGPASPSGFPPFSVKNEKDFFVEFYKVQIDKDHIVKGQIRLIVSLIDINGQPTGKQLKNQSTSYYYVNIEKNNGRYFPSTTLALPQNDIRTNIVEQIAAPISSPIFNVIPPKQISEMGGYVLDSTISYKIIQDKQSKVNFVTISKYRLENGGNKNHQKIVFHTVGFDTYLKENNAVLIYTEKQEWNMSSNDWLWQKMTRYDFDGNLSFHCLRMDNLPDKFVFPNDIKLPK